MKILVLCGDPWHPPQVTRQGLDALEQSEFMFDYIEDTRDWTPEVMQLYRCAILTKSDNASVNDHAGWMTDAVQASFSEYVQAGNGLFAIHSGTASYEQKLVLRGLLGGVFVQHPEQCPVTLNPDFEHPLCVGSSTCTLQDEHYVMALDDPQADVFMTTSSIHGEQPGAWRRTPGQGRVAVLTPGHNLEVWKHPSYQALVLNCLRWCGQLL